MRISYGLIRKARNIDPLLPYLLPQCRNIQDSKQELIWIKNNFKNDIRKTVKAVLQRYKGIPLQYILKTQPFAENLTILCKPNVLIPRWETDEICHFINNNILKEYLKHEDNNSVKVLDLCSGSGCMSLAIKESNPGCLVIGVDISKACIDLANENKKKNNLDSVQYVQGNVLNPSSTLLKSIGNISENERVDMIVANPPYVLQSSLPFLNTSVKNYEPGLALYGNLEFYDNFVHFWSNYCDSFFYELGEIAQFECVNRALDPAIWRVSKWIDGNGKLRAVYGYRKCSRISKMFDI